MEPHKLRNRRKIAAPMLAIASLAWTPCVKAQSAAGTVEFVSGQASISTLAGQSRAAERGTLIMAGDTIETTSGRLQMRMVDGAYISLQPQTLLRLDQYASAASGAGEQQGFLGLLRGGLRTITGAIGRGNRANYRLATPTATIGIRGTEFAVTADNGTRVNVTGGTVALCNDGGCLDVGAGQSGFAPDLQSRPTLSFAPASLPPTASSESRSFLAAEQRSGSGQSVAFIATATAAAVTVVTPAVTPAVIPVVPLANGAGGLAVASVTAAGFSAGLLGGTLTFAGSGALAQFIDSSTPTSNNYTGGGSTDFGADGIIAWGRWNGGLRGGAPGQSLSTMNYAANLTANAVTATSISGTYTAFGSTAPTVTSGGTVLAMGASNSVTGTLTVNFPNLTSGGSLTYQLAIPVSGQTFNINGSANQNFGTAFLGSSSVITSTGSGCTTACAGAIPFGNAIQGFFTGAAAQRAGANYGFTSNVGQVSGAVVFKK